MDALDVIEVIAEMSLFGQRLLNVYHLVADQPLDDADALADIGEYMDGLYTEANGVISAALAYTGIICRNLTENSPMGEISWPTLTFGGATGGSELPTQIAGLVTLPTAVSRRRGRKFVPGMVEAQLTGGLLESAAVAALADFGAYLLSGQSMTSGAGWFYRVVSLPLGPGTVSQATEAIVTNVPSALGRRRIGAGE